MIRPLTKRRGSGDRYTRPANIEAVIDAALALDWPALHQRSADGVWVFRPVPQWLILTGVGTRSWRFLTRVNMRDDASICFLTNS